jgi:dTDP-4-amino-4,6-dideoxygalactose transaminase
MRKLAIYGGKPVRTEFLIFGSPAIEQPEIDEVVASLRSGWLGTGPKVARFQQDFRDYKGASFAVAVSSCTAALHLSMLAAGLRPGDEVITTPLTFCATVNAIIHAGLIPVLADVDPITMNIEPEQIKARLSDKTRAILPVHFAGRACDMDAIMDIAKRHDLKVIEDCAHAIETEYHGKKAGTFGDLGCFSFYVTKNVVTGEGGMVITDNENYANRIKILALHGLSKDAWKRFSDEGFKHYQVIACGYKYNMMDIQASLGIHQLRRVQENWKRRLEIWNRYNKSFNNLPCITPAPFEKNTFHGLHLYTLLLDLDRLKVKRDNILNAMTKENIGTGIHYIALHLHPYYEQVYGYKPGNFPNAEWISERTISLPLSAKLSNTDVDDVIHAVTKVLRYFSK